MELAGKSYYDITGGVFNFKKYVEYTGGQILKGFQLRHIYFIDKRCREHLTVPEIPFSEIDRLGAGIRVKKQHNRKDMQKRQLKMKTLTPKQEQFCNYYIETNNASEAYRRAYNAGKMKDKQIWEEACKLKSKPNVAQRIADLQKDIREKSDVTKDEIIKFCTDVIRGVDKTDYLEDRNGRRTARTVSKTWAIERLSKMLGFDAPTEVSVNRLPLSSEIERLPDEVLFEMADKVQSEIHLSIKKSKGK